MTVPVLVKVKIKKKCTCTQLVSTKHGESQKPFLAKNQKRPITKTYEDDRKFYRLRAKY